MKESEFEDGMRAVGGCFSIVLFFVLSIAVSAAVGIYFGAAFGFAAFAAFCAWAILRVRRAVRRGIDDFRRSIR